MKMFSGHRENYSLCPHMHTYAIGPSFVENFKFYRMSRDWISGQNESRMRIIDDNDYFWTSDEHC